MANLLQHVRRSFVWPFPPGDEFATAPFFSVGQAFPDREAPPSGFTELVNGPFKSNAIVFACELKRMQLFSEARFIFRAFSSAGRSGKLFGNRTLEILERPWPRGTTGDLLMNMIIHADTGGNAFVGRSPEDPDWLRLMRPDWVTIVMGDRYGNPVKSAAQLDAEIIAFIYEPNDLTTPAEVLLAEEVAHWAPIPDPLARFRGMPWMTPIIREYQADQAATLHKLAFFKHGATPQTVVTAPPGVSQTAIEAFAERMDQSHSGWRNAYKTLYLAPGSTVTVTGKDLQQLDFAATQGKGETRIAAAAGLHPVLVPLSEGLQGSSLNAGNYAAARRAVADTTFRPLWRHVAGCLSMIVPPPEGSELWYDEPAIPFLHEDAKDQAAIEQVKASTLKTLIDAGMEPATAIDAVWPDAGLKHTGLTSVQLTPPEDGMAPPEPSMAMAGNGDGHE